MIKYIKMVFWGVLEGMMEAKKYKAKKYLSRL